MRLEYTLATGSFGLLRVLKRITVAFIFIWAHASVGLQDNSFEISILLTQTLDLQGTNTRSKQAPRTSIDLEWNRAQQPERQHQQ